jgi:beta-galactosidase
VQDFVLKKPHLWQGLEDPYLYKVVTQLISAGKVIDEVTQPLGLRRFELKAADGMYLNGKKVPMYGVCRHQDWWGLGSALTDEQHDTDLAIIKEIGATTIRFAHYQQAERIYAKCDSIGFIVWAEIPFVNRVSTEEADNAKQQLTELIRQNFNHPSIYIWGMHNEVYSPTAYTIALTSDLNDLAKTEDPDRYTASVSGYSKVDQACNLNADVQGINHYFGWYSGVISDVEKWIQGMERDFPGYKIIFSEYGAEANIAQQEETVGETGRYFSQFYPETFATKFHEIQWGFIAQHPYLLASYIWNTFDFATPVNTQGGVEARNMKGLVTFDRKVKKDPFYWYKANWSKEPVLYLTQRRAAERENRTTPVTVYSNLGAPQLFVNGREIGAFETGTTAVHYIFPNVELDEGENILETKVVRNGTTYTDRMVWNYSPTNRKADKERQPEVNRTEHIGL